MVAWQQAAYNGPWCLPVMVTLRNCIQVEMEVFDKMDNLVSQGEGDEEYRDLFRDM